jgi:riboflavin kinase/FMN adenylyltransferase
MKIFRDIEAAAPSHTGTVVALGNFDGIHVGHQALLRNAVNDARAIGVRSLVFTFDPHPLRLLAPARAPKLLLSTEDKLELFEAAGIDIVVLQRFDPAFANLEADDFVRRVLVGSLNLRKIWAGRDLRFGKGRRGTVDSLAEWGSELGFAVGIVEPVTIAGVRVSSSQVREMIDAGRVDEAMPLLGHYFFISGTVVAGQRRGRALGFPTANIASRTEVLPLNGIYATVVEIEGGRWWSASSIGYNPTFGTGPRTVESFIFDFDRDIYGQTVKLSFVKRIRDEQKFDSVEALVGQIHRDVAVAKDVLHEVEWKPPFKSPE